MDSENEYSDSESDTFDNDKDERDFVLFGNKTVQHKRKQTNRVSPCQSRTKEISDASAGKRKLNVKLPPLEDHREENNARLPKSAPLPSISLKVEEDKSGQNTTEKKFRTDHGVQPRVLSCKQAFDINNSSANVDDFTQSFDNLASYGREEKQNLLDLDDNCWVSDP